MAFTTTVTVIATLKIPLYSTIAREIANIKLDLNLLSVSLLLMSHKLQTNKFISEVIDELAL